MESLTPPTSYELVQPVTLENLLEGGKIFWLFILSMFVGTMLMPGQRVLGTPLAGNGERKSYTVNGLNLFLFINFATSICTIFNQVSLIPVIKYFWSIFVWANIFALGFSIYLMISRKTTAKKGNFFHDFWYGPDLNPSLFGVDLKMFFYQPSLIGLHLILVAFLDYQRTYLGHITIQMYMFQAFWWLYLFTHYMKEEFMLSTWDIIAEHFGFMLVWGDMVYLPFLYSLCGWYVADEKEDMAFLHALGVIAFHAVFHYIFRVSNWQKYYFKKYGKNHKIWGKPCQTLESENGETRLLISGFWGVGRHLNYTGEIGTYFSFALCCGFSNIIPYLLPVSLIILLSHRAHRDDKRCKKKYGALWDKYCGIAKFKIFPYVY